MTDTQAPDVVVTEADIVATADLFEAMHDKAAAWAVRSVGLCGTVHHATAEFMARHRLSTQSAMQARVEKLEAALRDIEQRCPIFASKDDGPDEIAVEVELTWRDLHRIRKALSNIGGSNDG